MNNFTLQDQYNTLIEEYQALNLNREDNPDLTLENHNITPTSLGGNNESSNLVMLPARIHYEAHYLLAKIHGGKMAIAFWFMSHKNTNSAKGVEVTAIEYEDAKSIFVKSISGENSRLFGKVGADAIRSGVKHTPETRAKMRATHTGMKASPEHCKNISLGLMGNQHTLGQKRSPEFCAAMSGANNPNYDHTIYNFRHNDGATFTGTRHDFWVKYDLHAGNLSKIIRGVYKTHKGWSLVKE